MKTVLQTPVLVINRAWQAIGEVSAEMALTNMCNGSYTAIDTELMRPTSWDEWLGLAVRENDLAIHTSRLAVRVPTVVCASNYSGMPKRRPRLNNEAIAKRDAKVCQYTGEYAPDGNVDHVVPVSLGGARKSWNNMVWCKRELNAKKGNKRNEDIGIKPIRQPRAPTMIAVGSTIKARHPDWALFLHS